MKKNLSITAIVILIALCNSATAQSWKLTGNKLDSNGTLGSKNNYDVKFITNGATRMTIKTDGKIGIGTKSPSAYLHVFGTTQIENNSGTIYDEPLLSIRSTTTNGTATNPVIAFKGEDTTFAIMGYDFSTRDIVMSTKEPLFLPNLVISRKNGFTGLNTKTPTAQLDINSNLINDALRFRLIVLQNFLWATEVVFLSEQVFRVQLMAYMLQA